MEEVANTLSTELEVLDVGWIENIMDEHLEPVLKKCKNLKKLDLGVRERTNTVQHEREWEGK